MKTRLFRTRASGREKIFIRHKTYSRFGEKTNNLQECLPPRQTRPKRNASGFEKDLVPGTDWMSVKAQKRNLDSEKEVHGRGSNLPRFIKW